MLLRSVVEKSSLPFGDFRLKLSNIKSFNYKQAHWKKIALQTVRRTYADLRSVALLSVV